MAEIATGNPQDAMDLVQEAMLGLVKNYAHKNPQDWGPLFHRILQNRIRDWYRRNSVRNKVIGWLGLSGPRLGGQGLSGHNLGVKEDEAMDPIQSAADLHGKTPEDHVRSDDTIDALDDALKQLPLRQQQAFLLRNWEGLNVQQTASAMGCSQSSVKTHYSRAVKSLRLSLENHYEAG